ncbi:hypothetical protein CR513_34240, partial [Mucuna pruriens]
MTLFGGETNWHCHKFTKKIIFLMCYNLVNKMKVYGEDILNNKVVDKILRIMLIMFDHTVTTIIESHNTDIMTIAELQGSIESPVNKILEKTKK